jgi:ectoine hydroxylase-related dioxygenase (phytanoyl-CoA dioxygenase family)
MHDIEIGDKEIARFERDGFIVFENFLDAGEVQAVRSRFEPLFRGDWETGLAPDEVNWQEGRDDPTRTRQLCNTWKSDYTVASIVLRPRIGEIAAKLSRWPGARLHLDNVIWKPPGAKALTMHQDASYNDYLVPNNMTSLWMALDDTRASAGTIEYVRGSHKWPKSPKPSTFLVDDYRALLCEAAKAAGADRPEIVPVEVPAGGLAIHHNLTWHGSGPNSETTRMRRSLVAHCVSSETRFHPTINSNVYVRYRRYGDTGMDESFFPILWHESGYRTPWIDEYMARAKKRGVRAAAE